MDAPQQAQVFISYSRRDQVFARRLFDHFSNQSIESWADWDDIPISAPWWEEIQRGIERCDAFLCVLSPAYMASEICNKELLYARQLNKRIIPLLRRPWRERGQPLGELVGEKAWADLIDENERTINQLNFLFFRKKNGFECEFDSFGKIVNPACDGIESDFDDFQTSFNSLIDAIQKDPAHLSEHTRLTIRATEWEQQGRNPNLLLRGDNLEQSEEWLISNASHQPLPSPLQQRYIQASTQARTHEQQAELARQARELTIQRQSVNRLRYLVGGLVIFLLVAAFLTNTAIANEASAIRAQATQVRVALEAKSLAWSSNARESFNGGRDMRGLALAVEAVSIPNPPRLALQTLTDIAYEPHVIRQFPAGRVSYFAVAPALNLLLTPNEGDTVRWWDIETGTMLGETDLPNDQILDAVGFSPDQRLAFGAQSHIVTVWETDTQQQRYTFETGGILSDVVFTTDSSSIIIGEFGGIAKQWSLTDGSLVRQWRASFMTLGGVTLDLSADGRWLAMQTDAEILVWDIQTGQRQFALEVNSFGMRLSMEDNLRFSPDGRVLALMEDEYLIRLIETATGATLATLAGHTNTIKQIAFSPDGGLLASASSDNTIRLWDGATGALVRVLSGHTESVETIAFSADSAWLASGDWDEAVIVWEIATGQLTYRFIEHDSPIGQVAFWGEHHAVFSTSGAQGILLRDIEPATLIRRYEGGGGSLAFSPDSQTFVDGGLTFWDVQSGRPITSLSDGDWFSSDLAFTADGRYLLTTLEDEAVRLWDVQTRTIWRYFEGHDEEISAIALSRDGQWAAAGYEDGTILVWDVGTAEVTQRIDAHQGALKQIDFSPDGRLLVSGGDDERVRLWDWVKGTALQVWDFHTSVVTIARFSPDGQTVLSGGWDRRLALWDAQSYALINTYQAHTDAINAAVFTPDGRYFLSTADDASVLMWETATGEIVRRYRGVQFLQNIAISPNGQLLAMDLRDRLLQVHRLDAPDSVMNWVFQNRFVRELTCAEREQYQTLVQCDTATNYATRTPYPTATADAPATPTMVYTPLSTPQPTITTTPQVDESTDDAPPPAPPGRG